MALGREERKFINVTAIVLIGTVLFAVLVYFPKSRAMEKLKIKVEKNDALIADIKRMIGQDTSLEEGVKALRKEAAYLNTKFIDQKDLFISINRLSESADLAGVRVVSVDPQTLSVFTKANSSVKYSDRACLKQDVKVVVEGRYEQLANYLTLLEKSPVGIFTVNGFSVTKSSESDSFLRMDVTIGLYIFGDENTARRI